MSGARAPAAAVPLRRLLGAARRGAALAAQRLRKGRWTFAFRGERYPYLLHDYNGAYANERTVEVPIVLRAIEHGGAILEIGNVLGHYRPVAHEVLDKYEVAPGVINADVADWVPPRRYDLVVSISTLEHVGWDEEPRDAGKIPRALARIRTWLVPGGRAVVTWPLGYNPGMDAIADTATFAEIGFLRRVSPDNRWVESDREGVRGAAYGSPFPLANAVAIAVLRP